MRLSRRARLEVAIAAAAVLGGLLVPWAIVAVVRHQLGLAGVRASRR